MRWFPGTPLASANHILPIMAFEILAARESAEFPSFIGGRNNVGGSGNQRCPMGHDPVRAANCTTLLLTEKPSNDFDGGQAIAQSHPTAASMTVAGREGSRNHTSYPQGGKSRLAVANASCISDILGTSWQMCGVIHMRTPWTLSNLEAIVFCGLVLFLAGAGTWVSVVG